MRTQWLNKENDLGGDSAAAQTVVSDPYYP